LLGIRIICLTNPTFFDKHITQSGSPEKAKHFVGGGSDAMGLLKIWSNGKGTNE
jgi:hypothetical protein